MLRGSRHAAQALAAPHSRHLEEAGKGVMMAASHQSPSQEKDAMPIYEFKCRQCGADFEELATMAQVEAGDVRCSECGSEQVERQISTFSSGSNPSPASTPNESCSSSGFG